MTYKSNEHLTTLPRRNC
uniref:Uncharacterized protein n=1 Tax=Arundo donax TaxID=35708 RepID=A0A0A9BT67_ARUDO